MNLAINGCSFECYKDVEKKNCCPGYWGSDCAECPENADRPCNNNGICSDGLWGNGTCSCKDGFVGTACEDCAPNRYGSTCSSVCTCVHGLCTSGLQGDGKCTCFSGYKGQDCDQEVPECSALRCQENSRCMEEAMTGKLVCKCMPGYQSSGTQCISINPCVRQVCHAHATCAHTGPNMHICACAEGYSGDGRVCMAVNPCQTNQGGCSAGTARCVYDGPGRSHCECLPGFHRLQNGVSCILQDICKPDSCHKNANCTTVQPGRVECTCHTGFLGNGKVCYGNIIQRLNELNTDPSGRWASQLNNAITLFGSLSWPLQNLGPFTVFIPISKGFRGTSMKTLMADASRAKYLCKMHIVSGEMSLDTLKKAGVYYTLTGKAGETDIEDSETKIRLHGSRKKAGIVESDVIASNGVIHIINKLIDSVPPTVDSDKEENLMKILSDYGKFSRFKSLLEKTDMATLMDLPGPYTVFAPTNDAFDAMKDGHLQYLSTTEGRYKLVEFLRNHILASSALKVYNAVSSSTAVTMANQFLSFNVTENGQILVNGIAVLEADVEAKNGCLYSLDGVLTPTSIEPVLPHRCDIMKTEIVKGNCVSCSKIMLSKCNSGDNIGISRSSCVFTLLIKQPPMMIPTMGCSLFCNTTATTPACCQGFYGPECTPCPGGFQNPCSGHGKCFEGIDGNGTCVCETNFRGSRCQYCASPNKYGPNCDKTCDCIHGMCNNRPEADGRCKQDSCLQGYTGHSCDRQTQACGSQIHYCHAHANCDFNQGALQCVCKLGYQGDGITCVEGDPCAPPHRGGCSGSAKCIKTGPGTHICQCLTGWMPDGDGCQPINNCNAPDQGGCHSNATCIYIGPGQSDCMCKPGYQGNGRECEAANRCVTQSGRSCHYLAHCRLFPSEWRCVCDFGYQGNGEFCYGTVEQEMSALPQATEFLKWMADFQGLSQSLSEQNITLLLPTSAAIGGLSSDDASFWTAKGNLMSLLRNHMIQGIYPLPALRNISSAEVVSLLKTRLSISTTNETTSIGGAAITLPNVPATNGLIHIIDKVLVPERKLSDGLLEVLALRPEFSLFRTYLIEHNLTDEVEHADEYTIFAPTDDAVNNYLKRTSATTMDVNTTRYHIVLSELLLETDLQAGGYKETMLGFSYHLGIFPRDGKLFVNEAQLNVTNLMTGKGVIHGLSAALEITRNRCDTRKFLEILGPCQNCFFPSGKICPSGTIRKLGEKKRKCVVSMNLDGERVHHIGCKYICRKAVITRRCCDGFFGEHCEPCPGPRGRPCSGNGACGDGIDGTGVCSCNEGFNGTACETCRPGKYSVYCDQECACKNGRCSEGPEGDGTCECDVGWRGIFCDQTIESKADELCGSQKCHTSANCAIKPSGTQCICAAGFEGNGTYCKAKDPCVVKNGGCSLNAVCKRTQPGRRMCVCNPGYAGDGLVCLEINPCLQGNGGCRANSDCIHTGPNKTLCVCSHGYSPVGQDCTMTDLCRKKNGECHRYAKCNMTGPGDRSCTCNRGYIGDGITCKGTVGKALVLRKSRDFYISLLISDISLNGRGPFTVFAPTSEAFSKERLAPLRMKELLLKRNREMYSNILRNHIVMCHTLLASDLATPRNLTTLAGEVLTTRLSQGSIFVNQANVTYSDDPSSNGILHEIDTILMPASVEKMEKVETYVPLNLTDVADRNGYTTFYKLLEDTGVMDKLNSVPNQVMTVFLPSDRAMASLPQEQKDFLYNQNNRAQLLDYLKYHILPQQKVFTEELVHLDSTQTLQGSALSFRCGGIDSIGEVFVNSGKCRIIQRHLLFNGGLAYGIDCMLTPPSVGGRCDERKSFDFRLNCGSCSSQSTRCPKGTRLKEKVKCDQPLVSITKNTGCQAVCTVDIWEPKCCPGYYGRDCLVCPGGAGAMCNSQGTCDDGHFGNGTCRCHAGFRGDACELCDEGHYGPNCQVCNCLENGSCDQGIEGTGACFCEPGWTGVRCESNQAMIPVCTLPCAPKAVCQENNTCVCRPFYEGDGFTCTVVDRCAVLNGGCASGAKCLQKGETVSCTCPKGHSGDGFSCQPIDPCAQEANGGCHEHATCTLTGPGKKKCKCKDNYIGDGVTCEAKELPINRCLQENGLCHQDAKCTDLHFEDATVGVFHVRSDKGQYRLNYTAARETCAGKGGTIATYTQLSYAQQAGLNLCTASWLDQARVAYPTTYANPNCGFGHVGIVDYGTRKNLSETWDTFCYRVKEVQCECKLGYIGDGYTCTGNLLQVLTSTSSFSNFLTQIRNYSQTSGSGREFVQRLSNLTIQSTLFVPDNTGLPYNKTLTQRDIEYHLSEGQALVLSELKNGSRIRTRLGSLTVLGIANFLDPKTLSSRYINDRFVIDSDILASNGVIHVLQGPLAAPPPRPALHAGHKTGMGIGVVVLMILVGAVFFVGYHFYTHRTKPFQFHYFKDEGEEEASPPPQSNPNIANPVYDAAPEPVELSSKSTEDKHEVASGGSYDLLQDS